MAMEGERFATLSVRQGALRGRRRCTPAGNAFLSFQGVPYAKPPVGELRFKAPVPLGAWSGVRDAIEPGNQCVQYDGFAKAIVGDEDCLFLNVFTPCLSSESANGTSLAVLFWIHGGGFLSGSSNMFQPDPFMDNGVILVTINYRIGPLGFLGLDTLEAPGNAGLKDQRMALLWVKENISVFGGDPNNITLFGQSAGGASVHFHVLSPLSKGLFRRAVVQSGSALLARNVARDPAGRAERVARAAGCDARTAREPAALLRWLRAAPAPALVAAADAAKTDEERRRGVLFVLVPCVEPPHPGAFLPARPEELLRRADASRVPLVFGITTHEGMLNLPVTLLRALAHSVRGAEGLAAAEAQALAELASHLERLLPDDLDLRRPERSRRLLRRVKDFYFDGQELSEDTLQGLVNLYTDVNYASGILRAADEHSRLGSPVYLYEFAFRGLLNYVGAALRSKVQGVCHGDELAYQFRIPGLPDPAPESAEALVRRRMGRLWANFATTGNPTPSLNEEIPTTWLPFTDIAPNYLRISENLTVQSDLLKERMQFWTSLYNS
ncbi:hypothetical protein R5R35_000756 [Gryllus longicercus]|uniref:Carboxylic ester hydrolase n=1 Tax=Gryllus longicercus TaxID=2509291 RepID=A0AAN9VSE4_9ORTH